MHWMLMYSIVWILSWVFLSQNTRNDEDERSLDTYFIVSMPAGLLFALKLLDQWANIHSNKFAFFYDVATVCMDFVEACDNRLFTTFEWWFGTKITYVLNVFLFVCGFLYITKRSNMSQTVDLRAVEFDRASYTACVVLLYYLFPVLVHVVTVSVFIVRIVAILQFIEFYELSNKWIWQENKNPQQHKTIHMPSVTYAHNTTNSDTQKKVVRRPNSSPVTFWKIWINDPRNVAYKDVDMKTFLEENGCKNDTKRNDLLLYMLKDMGYEVIEEI